MEIIKNNIFCSGLDCFKNDLFNTSLNSNNITHVTYKNLSIEQNPNIIYSFDKLIKVLRPKRVIEIGTFAGGLTLLVRDLLDYNGLLDSEVITYDVRTPEYLINQTKNIKIKSITKNLFSEDYSEFKNNECKNEILSILNQEDSTLVLCDGGSKKNEFKLISPLLKIGDVIMAHDYSYNHEYFELHIKNKFWNWLEIQDDDITEVSEKFNLYNFLQEDFINVAWVCKIKK